MPLKAKTQFNFSECARCINTNTTHRALTLAMVRAMGTLSAPKFIIDTQTVIPVKINSVKNTNR